MFGRGERACRRRLRHRKPPLRTIVSHALRDPTGRRVGARRATVTAVTTLPATVPGDVPGDVPATVPADTPATTDRRARSLAAFLGVAGLAHFAVPAFYDAMIPRALPGRPRTWTYGSGLAEIAVGAAVATPATRRAGAAAAAALFVAVLPGNVTMAWRTHRGGKPAAHRIVTLLRLPVQVPLVIWADRVRRAA